MTFETTIKEMLRDIEKLKNTTKAAVESIDDIMIPAQETIVVSAVLSDPVMWDTPDVVGTARVGFSEVT